MRISILLSLSLFILFMNESFAQRLLIGTYTQKNDSKGIYIYDFDNRSGKAEERGFAEAGNPSYLAVSANSRFVYAVNESNQGKIGAFAYESSPGRLSLINQQPNNGSAPCYISIDKTGQWLFSGNYSSGNLTVHPIHKDGSLGPMHQFIQHTGSSISKRQQSPHVHCTYVSNDNKLLYVPDLGLDKVMVYNFNASSGKLELNEKASITVSPGGGPRHIVFTKNGQFGYLVEELSGAVNVVERKGNNHVMVQTENRFKDSGELAGADIHLSPDEKFLYVSQRSNSTIQIFKVNNKTGRISFVGEQSTLGNFPRNFVIHPSGKFLLAANQKSDDITIFKRNAQTGLLTDTGERIKVPAPVCLKWIGGRGM